MNRMQKNAIYDEMCGLLYDYETGENEVNSADLYEMLVKIQNNWEYLTGDEDE